MEREAGWQMLLSSEKGQKREGESRFSVCRDHLAMKVGMSSRVGYTRVY